METASQSAELLQQRFNLAFAHLQARRWAEAESAFRHLFEQRPDVFLAQYNLGVALKNQRKWSEALAVFQSLLARQPNFPEACNNLGDTLYHMNRSAEAASAFRRAVTLRPNFSDAWNNLGIVLQEMKQPGQAIDAYRRALESQPDFTEAWNNLGNALRQTNQRTEAIDAYRRALTLRPDLADVWNNLGIGLRELKRTADAAKAYRRALALRPDFPEAWHNLANMLWELDQSTEAIEAYRRALALRGNYVPALTGLGGVLMTVGKLDEALACLDRAAELQPDDAPIRSCRLCTLHYHSAYDAAANFREARQWNDRFARSLANEIPIHDNDRSPDRRLRIGYVSRDFHNHCAAMFLSPLLAHHDHRGFEIFCYSDTIAPDAVTARLQTHADAWRDISSLSDPPAAQIIRQDRIDILVDLALHTTSNRLLVFVRKPAPIQATWLGYPGTTGLDAIDYRLTDPRLDPVEMENESRPFATKEEYYAERSVRLPDCFWCYDPRGVEEMPGEAMPDPGPQPARETGHVTFGCLNNFCKVTDQTLALWAGVIAAVPDSHLVLTAPAGAHRDRIAQKLGLPERERGRVRFVPRQPQRQYLATYRQIDLCLDTLPCGGGTTSLDALWMGVPVVTRVGQTVVGRAGWSLLHNLGLTELVAHSDGQFVDRAVGLAGDLERLEGLRATLRRRMEQSPLMDGPRFARNIEAAYRRMWQAWCGARQ